MVYSSKTAQKMASLIPFLSPQMKDGTYRVKIKVHHNGQRRIISTEIIVTPEDVTKKGKIKNQSIEMEMQKVLQEFRINIQNLGIKSASMNAEEISRYLTISSVKEIDFIEFAEGLITNYKKENKPGMAINYTAAIRSLKAFTGRESININELTSSFFVDYARYMKTANSRSHTKNTKPVGSRAVSLYTGIFRAIINKAKNEFNDEDHDIVVVKVNPFRKFKVPASPAPEKRALSKDKIIAIRNLVIPDENKREILARDCFLLSFYLIGINSADLFENNSVIDGRLKYERKKTRTRRQDKALISVKVEPEAEIILSRYNFRKLYSSSNNFNRAINIGLKKIGKNIKEPGLTFYAARHSWATIAANDCNIDKYTVHQALNHVDETMKVTDMYIRRDWSHLDRANRKVLDYILNKTESLNIQ